VITERADSIISENDLGPHENLDIPDLEGVPILVEK
jgi:hypothetical protein